MKNTAQDFAPRFGVKPVKTALFAGEGLVKAPSLT